MSYALLLAVLSSLSAAMVVIFDRVMMGGCYHNRPEVAWWVSALGGLCFGLPLSLAGWVVFADFADTAHLSWRLATETPDGVVAAIAGLVTIETMRHYFALFTSKGGEEVNETAVSMWLALTPVAIFVTVAGVYAATSYEIGPVPVSLGEWGLATLAVIGAVGALILFETHDGSDSLVWQRGRQVIAMLGCIVMYSLIGSWLFHDRAIGEVLALQPYYWLGYALGARGLLTRAGRTTWKAAWPQVRRFGGVIVVAELFGATVYLFEVPSFQELSATTINLVIGAHVVPVFVFAAILARWRTKKEARNETYFRFLGIEVETNNLPDTKLTGARIGWLLVVMATLGFAIMVLN